MQVLDGGVDLGLEIAEELSHDEWENLGRTIVRAESNDRWKLADWLNYGEDRYGGEGKYTTGILLTGLEYGTLRDVAYVGGRFAVSRRRDKLSFAHHREVAAITDENVQDELLDLAEQNGSTVKQLRDAVRGDKEDKQDEYVRVTVRIHRDLNVRLEQLAADDEMTPADWIWRCAEAEIMSRTELAA